jgi:hypothetical protein
MTIDENAMVNLLIILACLVNNCRYCSNWGYTCDRCNEGMILIDNKCEVSSNCSPGWVKVDY